jgi:hypothetical protein
MTLCCQQGSTSQKVYDRLNVQVQSENYLCIKDNELRHSHAEVHTNLETLTNESWFYAGER